jgi:hypothetical protein
MGGVFEVGEGAPNKLAASTAEGIEKLAASGGFSIITQAHETYSVREPPLHNHAGTRNVFSQRAATAFIGTLLKKA